MFWPRSRAAHGWHWPGGATPQVRAAARNKCRFLATFCSFFRTNLWDAVCRRRASRRKPDVLSGKWSAGDCPLRPGAPGFTLSTSGLRLDARRRSEFCGVARRARFFPFWEFLPKEGAFFSKDCAVFCQTRGDFVLTTPQKSLAIAGTAAEQSLFFPRITWFLGREFCGLGARGAKDKIGSGRADDGFLPRDFTVFARPFCF